jgi:cytochrome c-type biogenesis protein CcmF
MYYPGSILLWAATLLGAFSTVAFGLAISKREEPWLERGRQAFILMTMAVVLASCLLMYLFISHDYRLAYIWSYSDSSLPMHYLISSFWAGQEGSFLLWIFCGVLFGLPVMRFARQYESRVMLFYNLTLVSLLLLLLKQSPFRFHEGMTAIPPDGNGLNPLLQNPWMVIHPPVMFVGYASLAVPFAFALAALWMRRYHEWIRVSLPWVLISLLTLGMAIMMGGYWAYETLGWGGYWGWDPVENASLVPWLLTAALAHGMLLQRGSDRFRRLNMVLAILSYLTVVYATFLTRSGVLSDFSVHSFVDLGISGWLVFNMCFFLVLSIAMLVWRWREIPTEVGEEPFLSRTIFYVLGMIVLILTGVIVGFGTSAPLFTRLWGEPSQVGTDFYNTTGFYLAVALALVLGMVPFLTWHGIKSTSGQRLPITLAIVTGGLAACYVLGLRLPLAYIYMAMALLVIVANSWTIADKLRSGRWRNTGAAVSHIGIGLMLVGFLTTGWLDRDQKVKLAQGQSTEVLDYSMTFLGPETNALGREEMRVEVSKGDGKARILKPLMWINRKSNQMVANPDIQTSLTTDLYLAPSEYIPASSAQTGSSIVIKKNEPAKFKGWSLLLHGFDTAMHDSSASGISVASRLTIQPPDKDPVELLPLYVSQGMSAAEGIPIEVPGTGTTVKVLGIDADRGLLKLELTGITGGVARKETMTTGQSFTYQDLEITMVKAEELPAAEPAAGPPLHEVTFAVSTNGESNEVKATYGGETGATVVIPGTSGVMLGLAGIDAETGAAVVSVYDPHLPDSAGEPASLVLDVSTKPLILLVWIGTLLALAGNFLAILRRWRDVGAIAKSSPDVSA